MSYLLAVLAVSVCGSLGAVVLLAIQRCTRPHSGGEGEHPTPNTQHPTSNGSAPGSLVFVRAWRPMTPEQWAAAFANWPEEDPRWRALWDCLSFHLEAELSAGQGVKADRDEVMQWNGRVQMLLFIRTQLLTLRRATKS